MLKQLGADIPVSGLCTAAVHALGLVRHRTAADLALLGISPESTESMLAKVRADLDAHVDLCESPIEQVMLVALAHMVVPKIDCFPPAIHRSRGQEPWPVRPVVICPQFAIARYRLDFMVRLPGRWIAVECDGAEHHDSIQGRSRDATRDGYLEAMDIATLRYTGRWIHRNFEKVADEIAAIAEADRP